MRIYGILTVCVSILFFIATLCYLQEERVALLNKSRYLSKERACRGVRNARIRGTTMRNLVGNDLKTHSIDVQYIGLPNDERVPSYYQNLLDL